jgi:sterol desaturase/sphingolipid hydroxylase (fatty acid hydroxylase superfamily)
MLTKTTGFHETIRSLSRRRYVRFGLFLVVTVAAGMLCQHLAEYIQEGLLVPPFHLPPPFSAVNVLFFFAAVGSLVIEAVVVGWQECSIRRLAINSDESTNTDLMYLLIWVSGVMTVMTVIMTLGLTLFLSDYLEKFLGFGLLSSLPFWAQALIAIFWRSFTGYWEHRFSHSRWFWNLHKSHHSPTDFTVLTAFREHPIEIAFGALIYSITLAPLGLSPNAIVVMQVMAGFVPMYLHSKMYGVAWLERLGIATPAGHRLHHSAAEEHFDVNFGGTLNIWDRLFGTYVKPYPGVGKIPIGVDDSVTHHNTERPYAGILIQAGLWLRALWLEGGRLLGKRADASPHA